MERLKKIILNYKIKRILKKMEKNDKMYHHRRIPYTTWLDINKGLKEELRVAKSYIETL